MVPTMMPMTPTVAPMTRVLLALPRIDGLPNLFGTHAVFLVQPGNHDAGHGGPERGGTRGIALEHHDHDDHQGQGFVPVFFEDVPDACTREFFVHQGREYSCFFASKWIIVEARKGSRAKAGKMAIFMIWTYGVLVNSAIRNPPAPMIGRHETCRRWRLRRLNGSGHMGTKARPLHERDGEGTRGHGVGNGRTGHRAEECRGHDRNLGRSARGACLPEPKASR